MSLKKSYVVRLPAYERMTRITHVDIPVQATSPKEAVDQITRMTEDEDALENLLEDAQWRDHESLEILPGTPTILPEPEPS